MAVFPPAREYVGQQKKSAQMEQYELPFYRCLTSSFVFPIACFVLCVCMYVCVCVSVYLQHLGHSFSFKYL